MIENFQAESTSAGNEFEDTVEKHLSLTGNVIEKNYVVQDTGVEVDFLASNVGVDGKVRLELVEAKGGRPGDKKRPGAERTDNVKKAVANGAILKFLDPSLYYVVYFSAPPKPDSYADHMLRVALQANYIDEIRYI